MWFVFCRFYLDKVFITLTGYAIGNELHGCYREAMLKLTHDVSPCYIAKGTAPYDRLWFVCDRDG